MGLRRGTGRARLSERSRVLYKAASCTEGAALGSSSLTAANRAAFEKGLLSTFAPRYDAMRRLSAALCRPPPEIAMILI